MGQAGALSGVRVIAIGAEGLGSLATRPLAEHGATVLRVEAPRAPGPLRRSDGGDDPDASAAFARLAPDQWSVAIDTDRPAGVELVQRLVAVWADVVAIFGDGPMARGLAPGALRMQKPELIVVTGPSQDASRDPIAAQRIALRIAAALFARHRRGTGRHIEVPDAEGIRRDVSVGADTCLAACFDARGAPIAIEIRCDEEWQALVAALGAPQWATEPSFATPLGRFAARERIEAEIAGALCDEAPYPLMARLQEAGVPCGVVQEGPQILRDPQLAHRRHFVVLDHAVLGRIPYERSGFRLSATPGGFDDSAPLLGEDGDVVFGEILKVPADEIARLVADGVIELPVPPDQSRIGPR